MFLETDVLSYSDVRLIAILLLASFLLVPDRAFNVNSVVLIAISPISKQISCKMRLAIYEHRYSFCIQPGLFIMYNSSSA